MIAFFYIIKIIVQRITYCLNVFGLLSTLYRSINKFQIKMLIDRMLDGIGYAHGNKNIVINIFQENIIEV